MVAALVYLLAAALAARMDRDLLGPDLDNEPPQTREAVRRVARGLVDGARHVWHHRPAGHALAAIGAHRFFYGVSTITAILLFRYLLQRPGRRRRRAGRAGEGVRGVRRRVLPGRRGHTRGRRTGCASRPGSSICFALAAVVEAVFVVVLTEWLLLVGAFVVGVAAQGSKICVDTIVQESVDDAYRGRVFSFYDVIFNIAFVSAAAFGAVALPADGNSRAVFAVVAVGYAVTAVGYARATERLTDPHRTRAPSSWRDRGRTPAQARRGRRGDSRLVGPPAAQLGLGVLAGQRAAGRGAPP